LRDKPWKNWKSVRIEKITILGVESDVEGKQPWLCGIEEEKGLRMCLDLLKW